MERCTTTEANNAPCVTQHSFPIEWNQLALSHLIMLACTGEKQNSIAMDVHLHKPSWGFYDIIHDYVL